METEEYVGPGYATEEFQENLRTRIMKALIDDDAATALSLCRNLYVDGRRYEDLQAEAEQWDEFEEIIDEASEVINAWNESAQELPSPESLSSTILDAIDQNRTSAYRSEFDEDITQVIKQQRLVIGSFVNELSLLIAKTPTKLKLEEQGDEPRD